MAAFLLPSRYLTSFKGGQRNFAIKCLSLPSKLGETAHARQNEQALLLSLNRSFATETITKTSRCVGESSTGLWQKQLS